MYASCADPVSADERSSRPGAGFAPKAALFCLFLLLSGGAAHAAPQQRPDASPPEGRKIAVYLFWGRGCTHCEEEKRYLAALAQGNPDLDIREYEVLQDEHNLDLLTALMKAHGRQTSGVPITFIGGQVFEGFSAQTSRAMERAIRECRKRSCPDPADLLQKEGLHRGALLPQAAFPGGAQGFSFDLPVFGALDLRRASLPVLTLVIAGMDSFNPCAFFVLLSLLGLLVHARSRNKMLLVGFVFVFFSGFIYFLSMAAWLNLFLVMGNVSTVTAVAGTVSLAIASVNIKDFFAFKKGLSLSIPDSAKPRLFDRIRKLVHSTSVFSILAGTIILAIMANFYELLCTAGFPMVFTRVLTLDGPSTFSSYLYLLLYNVVRVIPLFVIVLAFSAGLGGRKLTERQGRVLKLVSGTMMLGLGTVLLVNPTLLNSLMISVALVAGAVGAAFVLAAVTWRLGYL